MGLNPCRYVILQRSRSKARLLVHKDFLILAPLNIMSVTCTILTSFGEGGLSWFYRSLLFHLMCSRLVLRRFSVWHKPKAKIIKSFYSIADPHATSLVDFLDGNNSVTYQVQL